MQKREDGLTPMPVLMIIDAMSERIGGLPQLRFSRAVSCFHGGTVEYYCPASDSRLEVECLAVVEKNPAFVARLRGEFERVSQEFLDSLPRIEGKGCRELALLYRDYCLRYREACDLGEPFVFMIKESLERRLLQLLKGKGVLNPVGLLQALSSPMEPSFIARQEAGLLRIAVEFGGGWPANPAALRALELHAQEFSWVEFDYGVRLLSAEDFGARLGELLARVPDAAGELRRLGERERNAREAVAAAEREAGLDGFEKALFKASRDAAFIMDLKKERFTKSHVWFRALCAALGRTAGVDAKLVAYALPGEWEELAAMTLEFKAELEARSRGSVFESVAGVTRLLPEAEAQRVLEEFPKAAVSREVRGKCACDGSAVGRVRVITGAHGVGEMRDGEVLVSIMTTPGFVPAMRKAAAIVTDEGGVTCHAAIVSRELGIPCIVGTGNATRALKTGRVVEVNADEGRVTVLEGGGVDGVC